MGRLLAAGVRTGTPVFVGPAWPSQAATSRGRELSGTAQAKRKAGFCGVLGLGRTLRSSFGAKKEQTTTAKAIVFNAQVLACACFGCFRAALCEESYPALLAQDVLHSRCWAAQGLWI